MCRFPDDDLRGVARTREAQQLLGGVLSLQPDGLRPELLGEAQVLRHALAVRVRHPQGSRRLHEHGDAARLQARGHPSRGPYDARRRGAGAHRDEDPLGGRPDALDAVLRLVQAHLRVDALGGAPQRELAKGDEVALAKEALDGAAGLVGDVDLALLEAFEQLVGRQVDQTDLGSLVQHAIGDGLADDDARDLSDDVVQAVDVLDVERRVDVDSRVEELLHVLPSLRVSRARSVGVRELVDEDEPGPSRERRVEVELLDDHPPMVHLSAGQELQADDERARIETSVGLDHADDDVALQVSFAARSLEHRVGLADTRRRAEEDDELAAARPALLRGDAAQELFRIGSRLVHGHTLRQGRARAARFRQEVRGGNEER